MAINTLANFGVPGVNAERGPQLQPIFTQNFRVLLYGFGIDTDAAEYAVTRQVKRISLPSKSFETVPIHTYTSTVYVAGRGEWQEGSLVLADDINSDARRLVENQLTRQKNFHDQTTARAGQNYKYQMDIDVLAGGATAPDNEADPNILRRYSLAGCWLTSVEDGEMAYETAGPKDITMRFRFDNSIMTDYGGEIVGNFPLNYDGNGILTTGAALAPASVGAITLGAGVDLGLS